MGSIAKSVSTCFARGAIFTAGQLAGIAARIAYAAVEGLAFAFGRSGISVILTGEILVLTYHTGPRRAVTTAAGLLTACVLGRATWVLFHTTRHHPTLESIPDIWSWEPKGDSYDSGAWHVLRALVRTANIVKEENPGLAKVLSQDALQPSELAVRLYYLYALHQQEPIWDQFEPLEAGKDSSDREATAQSDSIAKVDVSSGKEHEPPMEVPRELLQQLCYYRPFACYLYDYCDDEALAGVLGGRGHALCFASYEADLTSGSPAYFMCWSEDRKEVLLSVRGTYSPEDIFTDLLATGETFDGGSYFCHSGMCKGAVALHSRYGALLATSGAQGYTVTLVGHSLGAGVVAMLACLLKQRGVANLRCYAFEPPACMDRGLAESCEDVVLSMVTGDDIVPRLSAEMFARFLEELASFDYMAVAEGRKLPKALSVVQHLSELISGSTKAIGAATWLGGEPQSNSGDVGGAGKGADAGKDVADTPTAAALQDAADAVRHPAHDADKTAQEGEGADSTSKKGGACGEGALKAEGECGKVEKQLAARIGGNDSAAAYNPFVPGRIVFIYRLQGLAAEAGDDGRRQGTAIENGGAAGQAPAELDGETVPAKQMAGGDTTTIPPAAEAARVTGETGSPLGSKPQEEAAAEEEVARSWPVIPAEPAGWVMLKPWHPALRSIRITNHLLTDHFIDTAFTINVLAEASRRA